MIGLGMIGLEMFWLDVTRIKIDSAINWLLIQTA